MSDDEQNDRSQRRSLTISATPYARKVKKPEELSDEQFANILYTFTLIDANKDGRISKLELKDAAFLIGMNPTDRDIKAWWKIADTNQDGFIDVNEYVAVMKSNYSTLDIEKERLKAAFRVLDRNGDGLIHRVDFIHILTCNNSSISKEEADKMFTEADTSRKGFIVYKDFVDSKLCTSIFQ
ncbi:uncharacterized protein LOC134235077 [Saccostrea cucullata]|uniref:uncharacterized protein LOC134235077 n=1 Tax=Saccostrea cuccullata TaxID=36930 RepID=UPI002ED66C3F